MSGYDKSEAVCGMADYSDEEFWEAFDYLLAKGQKTVSYKFIFLLGLLCERENADDVEMWPFPLVFRGFTREYWQAVLKYPAYFAPRHEAAAQVVLDYMAVYGNTFAVIPSSVQSKIFAEITKRCQQYVIGAVCNDLQHRVYGYSKKEQRIWFNASAYAFLKSHAAILRRKAEAGLAAFVAARMRTP